MFSIYKTFGKSLFFYSLLLIGSIGLSGIANASVSEEIIEYHNRVARYAHSSEYHNPYYLDRQPGNAFTEVFSYGQLGRKPTIFTQVSCKKCQKVVELRGDIPLREVIWTSFSDTPCPKDIFKVDLVTAKDLSEFWSEETKALIKPYLVKDKASKEKWDRIYDALLRKAKAIDARK